MSGHSKWSTIKRKKGAKDVEKGKIFSKMSRIVTLAVIEGGGIGDPEKNVRLRLAIEKAKAVNMPKENIGRAIEKGAGPNRQNLKEVIYEGFGPSGINLIITAATDNPNRSLTEIRNTLDRNGGKMGIQGSVSYMFRKCGSIIFDKKANNETAVFEFAENINALDIEDENDSYTVYFPFENLGKVKDVVNGLVGTSPEVDYKPQTYIKVEEKGEALRVLKLIDALEELDDVQRVYANFNIPDELMAL